MYLNTLYVFNGFFYILFNSAKSLKEDWKGLYTFNVLEILAFNLVVSLHGSRLK